MDTTPVLRFTALFPDLPECEREFEVTLTVPREDGGLPLVPTVLPGGILGCWSAESVTASVTVMASRASGAVAAVEALLPDLAGSPGASFAVASAMAS